MLHQFLRTARKPIAFVSASSERINGTTVTVTAPTGIENGHLLVAIFYAAAQSVSSLPSGFTVAYTDNTASNPRIIVGWKIASNESGNYTFTAAASTNIAASILVYSNASLDVVGTINRLSSSATAVATSISPTSNGILIASFSSSLFSPTITSEPSGMTQRTSSGGAPNTFIYDELLTSSGSTSSRTLTFSLSTGNTSGIQISLK